MLVRDSGNPPISAKSQVYLLMETTRPGSAAGPEIVTTPEWITLPKSLPHNFYPATRFRLAVHLNDLL